MSDVKYHDMPQRSPLWHAIRRGKMTASRAADIMSKGAAHGSYLHELIAETVSQETAPNKVTSAMQWGIDQEESALFAYEMLTGETTKPMGFITNKSLPGAGVSPDGLVGSEGIVELKCPTTKTHVGYYLGGKMPAAYRWQVQMLLAITERSWCDFVSYDPRVKGRGALFCLRVEPNPKDQELLKDRLLASYDTLQGLLEKFI